MTPPRRTWVRRTFRILALIVAVIVVVTGGYVGYVAIRRAQAITLPAPTGPYPIGRTQFDWTDHSRTDPLAPQQGIPRELSVWLWYPAPQHTGGPVAPYLPDGWAQLHIGAPIGLGESSFDAVHDHALAGSVPVAAGRHSVVVLEPGLGLAAPQYTTLAENLASHGYLVAGVTPTYSANVTVVHGQVVQASATGNPKVFDTAEHTDQAQAAGNRLIGVWVADARFAAAQVATLNRAGLFAGHVDPAHIVYIGHSFGGAASLEACRTDPNCDGAADLDGTQFGPVVHLGLGKPMLLLGSENSCVTGACQPPGSDEQASLATARTLLAASTGPTGCYQIDGTQHFNFSDYAAYYFAAPLRSVVPVGSIDGDLSLEITDAYLTAFVDHAVTGVPEPLLTDHSSPYAQVRVQRVARS